MGSEFDEIIMQTLGEIQNPLYSQLSVVILQVSLKVHTMSYQQKVDKTCFLLSF